jgi:glycine oxidase
MAQQTSQHNSSNSQSIGQSIGIVGAGLMGRLLAWQLSKSGHRVTLFERDDETSHNSCGYAGAGMLAPIAELETAEPIIAQLGFESLALWETIVASLELPVFFRRMGTLVVAHHLDMPELQRFSRLLKHKVSQLTTDGFPLEAQNAIQWELTRTRLREIEPHLGNRFQTGIFLPDEGQIDNRHLLTALANELLRQGVNWICNTPVQQVQPHSINDGQTTWQFKWVIDCRGLGARPDWSDVRGVRGEIVRVHAPDVILDRPVRLMHPRYPLYIVPRENHHYLIGATSIESDDRRPMTVQSALELLSAAFTVHPGFAEASIMELIVNCRPALPDNLPCIHVCNGLIRINGLYRHGFLISPKLSELVCKLIDQDRVDSDYAELFDTTTMRDIKEIAYAATH